jgi:ABC-type transporter Mla MlaB component
MTFRIEETTRGRVTVFLLSGRIENEAIVELRRLFKLHKGSTTLALDLKDVSVVDRSAVHFLMDCESQGIKLENCPSYIRGWIDREKD